MNFTRKARGLKGLEILFQRTLMRKILGLTLVLAFFTGCATISNQMSQRVAIGTNTGDAVTADINGQKVMLPASVKISRSNDTVVKILPVDNPGYEATQLVIVGKQEVSLWFWGNILWGGTSGSLTDWLTGGMWQYSNPNFVVPVKKVEKKK